MCSNPDKMYSSNLYSARLTLKTLLLWYLAKQQFTKHDGDGVTKVSPTTMLVTKGNPLFLQEECAMLNLPLPVHLHLSTLYLLTV